MFIARDENHICPYCEYQYTAYLDGENDDDVECPRCEKIEIVKTNYRSNFSDVIDVKEPPRPQPAGPPAAKSSPQPAPKSTMHTEIYERSMRSPQSDVSVVDAPLSSVGWKKPQPEMQRVWFQKAMLWTIMYIGIFWISFVMFDFITGIPVVTMIYVGLLIVFGFILKVWARLFYKSYRYVIKDVEIMVEYGVLFHRMTIIPFERIQNVHVVQGPLMRFQGLKSVMVETAGGSMYRAGPTGTGLSEGQIPAPRNPDEMAQYIMERVRHHRSREGL